MASINIFFFSTLDCYKNFDLQNYQSFKGPNMQENLIWMCACFFFQPVSNFYLLLQPYLNFHYTATIILFNFNISSRLLKINFPKSCHQFLAILSSSFIVPAFAIYEVLKILSSWFFFLIKWQKFSSPPPPLNIKRELAVCERSNPRKDIKRKLNIWRRASYKT